MAQALTMCKILATLSRREILTWAGCRILPGLLPVALLEGVRLRRDDKYSPRYDQIDTPRLDCKNELNHGNNAVSFHVLCDEQS